jgi:hypothetical protein
VSIAGRTITLAWMPPTGSTPPTAYVLEGGVHPGEVLASIPVAASAPMFTFAAPPGVFFVRLHSVSGTRRSVASNEIRLVVDVPAPPSAPVGLRGLADGSSLVLSWTNTLEGGAATSLALRVGPGPLTIPLPAGADTFTFDRVPIAGTYTFTVAASNAAGTSAPSNTVTLRFPGSCPGVPGAPTNFLVWTLGTTIVASWSPPADQSPVTAYVVRVEGAFVGSVPTTARQLSGAVAPGTYTLRVEAVNRCGTGAATDARTVTIP